MDIEAEWIFYLKDNDITVYYGVNSFYAIETYTNPFIVLRQKSTHWNPRASVRQARKVDQACQSIWPVDWQGDRVNVKFEGVSAGFPKIPHTGVSAGTADADSDQIG